MVWGNTGLPSIDAFTPDQPTGTHLKIGALKHKGRTFPSQFKGDRCEVCGRSGQDFAADVSATGEKDMVKRHGHQLCCDGTIALLNPHDLWLEMVGDQLGD